MADGLWKAISKALRGDDEDEEKGEKTDVMKARESHSAALEDSGYDEGVRGALRVGVLKPEVREESAPKPKASPSPKPKTTTDIAAEDEDYAAFLKKHGGVVK